MPTVAAAESPQRRLRRASLATLRVSPISSRRAPGTFAASMAPDWVSPHIPCARSMPKNWASSCACTPRVQSICTLPNRPSRSPNAWPGLGRAGAVVGLCPITEANLGDGIFPAVAFEQSGGPYAIGSDSNVRIAANEELRSLEYSQRLRDQRRNRLGATGASSGRALLQAVCAGGVRALGFTPVGVGLAAGQRGDIVV